MGVLKIVQEEGYKQSEKTWKYLPLSVCWRGTWEYLLKRCIWKWMLDWGEIGVDKRSKLLFKRKEHGG